MRTGDASFTEVEFPVREETETSRTNPSQPPHALSLPAERYEPALTRVCFSQVGARAAAHLLREGEGVLHSEGTAAEFHRAATNTSGKKLFRVCQKSLWER